MKLKTIHIKNFRCYKDQIDVNFDDITTFVGKNDIGKSAILEALEIFFNNDVVKIEQGDLNNHAEECIVSITCDFDELPDTLILDEEAETNLSEEYLTIDDGLLRIRKDYDCSKAKPSEEIFIVAKHPTQDGVNNLLSLKEKDLQKIIKDNKIEAALKGNPSMRKSIWDSCEDLKLAETSISVTKGKEDAAKIWASLNKYLPTFALFQSDRSSKDSDVEVQNPMKGAIQEALSEAQDEIDAIKRKVRNRAMEIATDTHNVMKSLDPDLASSLTPSFSDATISKWATLFSVSMNTNDDIPLNKRGSGIRRLVLVGFFKAQADKRVASSFNKDIIYAIEEPETSLHPNYQTLIIQSFQELSQSEHCQVILTTHSPNLAKELPVDSVRFITRDKINNPEIRIGHDIMGDVASTLGLLPDVTDRVKLMICVEGPTDVIAIKSFSKCLHSKYPEIVDLNCTSNVVVIPLGGSTLKHWVQEQYLKNMGCPEVHIYDNDVNTYQKSIDKINARTDGSWGTLTQKFEIENYLHPDAIKEAYGVDVDTSKEGVPSLFGKVYAEKKGWPKCTDNTSKTKLSVCFEQKMNIDRLEQMDPNGEIKGWFDKISALLK